MSGPTREELLAMAGGIDPLAISDAPVINAAAPAIAPVESESNIKRRLESSIESFLDSDTAMSQANGGHMPKMQFSDSIDNAIQNAGAQTPMNIAQAANSSPMERFKAFIAIEKQLNPKFDVSVNLDGMIDYLIEQENLEAKFAAFNTPNNT